MRTGTGIVRAGAGGVPGSGPVAGRVSAMLAPPLTTVHQPMRLLGERACSMLLERIANPALPYRAERLPTTLVIRESCGCPPSPDREP